MRNNEGGAARILIRRREAAALGAMSLPTLARRERTDPRIPARVLVGPGRYAYRLDEWAEYLDGLPRADAPEPPTAEASERAAKASRKGVAARQAAHAAVERARHGGNTPEQASAEARGVVAAHPGNAPKSGRNARKS